VPDDATCRRYIDPKRYDLRRATDGIAAGRLRYDGEAAATCLGAGRDAICSGLPFTDASCARVFVGLVPEGGHCTGAHDCAGGASCDGPCNAGCCDGTCGAPVTPSPAPVLSPIGGPCTSHPDCVPTAYCERDGTCHALPDAAGEHCLFGCTYGDLYCDVSSETCLAYAAIGAACDAAHPCVPGDSFCGDDGSCHPRPGAGEACDTMARLCVPATTCQAGVCQPRGTTGAPCAADAECDVACDTAAGVCAAYASCP
jgi:hypothetical protein